MTPRERAVMAADAMGQRWRQEAIACGIELDRLDAFQRSLERLLEEAVSIDRLEQAAQDQRERQEQAAQRHESYRIAAAIAVLNGGAAPGRPVTDKDLDGVVSIADSLLAKLGV